MGEDREAAEAQAPEPLLEPEDGEANGGEAAISEELFADLAGREEFLQSVTEKGFGVRSSAYDYRITGRGGPSINNMDLTRRPAPGVPAFSGGHHDPIMLWTACGLAVRRPAYRT